MRSTLLVQYTVAVTVLVLTPGPDMLFCVACGLAGGPRAGFCAALGTATGEAVHVAASAAGLAAIVTTFPDLTTWLRSVGAIVLIALGIHTLLTRRQPHARPPVRRAYLQGLVTDLLNPKTALFSVVFLPQFVDPRAGNVAVQFAVLGALFVALEIVVDGMVGMQAGRAASLSPLLRKRRALETTGGLVLLGLGIALALSH